MTSTNENEENVELRETKHSSKRKRSLHDEPDHLDIAAIRRGSRGLRPGQGVDRYDETEYYFENGLRKVYPYTFIHNTFAKGRWVGRELLEVFTQEFRAQSTEYYKEAISTGRVLVNNEKVDSTYKIKDNDMIVNKIHRHEVPVIGCPIKIIHDDDDMLVVDKPPSIPVHPCGRYRHNTVLFILAKEHGFRDLHTVHRLDRLTSGVLMFAKTLNQSKHVDTLIKERQVAKEYLCRVVGEFPEEEVTVDKAIKVFSNKVGVCGVSDEGKSSMTSFKRLSFNGKSSVVLAKPKQGRMHQIRVHLQYLGFPIVNDTLYNDEVFGKNKAKGGLTEKTVDQLVTDLIKVHTLENWLKPMSEAEIEDRKKRYQNVQDKLEKVTSQMNDFFEGFPQSLEHYVTEDFRRNFVAYDEEKMSFSEHCNECRSFYTDPPSKDLLIYLHCYRYGVEDFFYTAAWPNWAKETWTID